MKNIKKFFLQYRKLHIWLFSVLGVLLALFQRIKEIQRGEEDDAKSY